MAIYNNPGPMQRNRGPLMEEPQPPPQMQRQAVIDQLGTPPAAGPVAQNGGTFSRGGQVKQLPGAGADMANNLVGAGVTAATTAAGAFNPVSMGTDYLGKKLKPKEEMPTFGGENGAITDDYGRRFEGTGPGVAGGAVRGAGYGAMAGPIGAGVGAAIGGIVGAATKNAPSAFSDFRVEDAADALGKEYQRSTGRAASEDEIKGRLVGQGWDPNGGDRWVGEKNLFDQMREIRQSPEAEAFRRGAVIDQLGTGAEPVATNDVQPRTAGAGAATNPGTWNTDGYAAPGYVPERAGAVPAGWDAGKWNDPNHQTPKYGVGRILSNFPPTVEGLAAAMPDIERAYPGTTFNGKDKITIPGVGTVDVLEAAGLGGRAWRWGAEGGGGGGSASGAAPATASATVDLGARRQQPDVMDKDTLAQIRAELERIMTGTPDRDALLAQMGGANG